MLGQNVEMLVPPRLADAHVAFRKGYSLAPEARPMGIGRDLRGRRKDGGEFPLEIGLNPVRRNGKTDVLATVIDISERKRAQERQQFLISELHHRSRNLFAVIYAIATRSFIEGQSSSEAQKIFSGRLHALARAHEMLAEAAWEGAPLAEIARRELASFTKNADIRGCDIMLNTQAAQQFALIIHELATNAAKYGAFSVPRGRVSVEGQISRSDGKELFVFHWSEKGGPKVGQPIRKGFGTAILLGTPKQFGEQVELKYDPQGLQYEMRLPLAAIQGSNGKEPDLAS